MHTGVVWYPVAFSHGQVVAALPEDLEPRMLEPGQPATFPTAETGVLLLDGPVEDEDAALIESARRATVPVVVLSPSGEGAPAPDGLISLALPVAPATLAGVLRAACEQVRLTRAAEETTRQLEELNDIGVRLSAERDITLLLELILTKARTITRSDAGSIYLIETAPDGSSRLRFELAQNDSVPVELRAVALPLSGESLAGHVALTGESLNVADAYALPAGQPYRFNPDVDALAGYRTKSLLVLPMRTPAGEIIGVLTLINGKRESGRAFTSAAAIEREALPYSDAARRLAQSLASQAAVALANARLYAELERALEDLRKSQDQLVQVERLRALGEMAAGVAHDFNNLLAVVTLRADLLLARGPAPDVAESLTMIRQAAHDGAQTVRRIQEFTRTRSTQPFGRVDVAEVLREVVELARPRWRDEAQSRGVTYDVRVAAGSVPVIAGTVAELREALLNLLNNGLEAMPAGGSFTFEAGTDGAQVVIRATDSGCGMSEATRRRVFQPFFTTKGTQGNGLGLSVVWGIIARHGGEIAVDSTLGRGTTFTIRLPVPAALPAEPSEPDDDRLPEGTRVLLVDDNLEILRGVGEVLRDSGCRVIEAPDGSTALARLEAEPVDLVLTDLAMPGLSGWEVALGCRDRCPEAPIGLITGFGDQLSRDKLESHGIRFVVAKPFSSEELLRAVAGSLRAPTAVQA
jgi:signal transduction histidine kinase/CheY-like chemotaxis protein